MPGIVSFSEMASDEDDSLVTVVTCEGNLTDPDFPYKLSSLVARLRRLLPAGDKPFHVTNVEPWNSVRVTFTIPREAAQRLRQLAQEGDRVLRDLGILSVQIEGDQVISLTIAGRFNEPQEIILRPTAATAEESRSVASSNQTLFDLEGGSPASSSVETTRKNIAQYLSQQGSVTNAVSDVVATASTSSSLSSPSSESSSSLFSGNTVPSATDFKSPNVVAPGSEPIPFPPKTNLHVPARTTSNFGPFPFASMTHAMNTMHGSQGHHQNQTVVTSLPSSTASSPSPRFPFSPPPPYPGTSTVGGAFQPVRQSGNNFPNHLHTSTAISSSSSLSGATSPSAALASTATSSSSIVNNLSRGLAERANAALASPLLVNLLQSDVTASSASPHSSQGCKVFPPPPSEPTTAPKRKRKPRKSKERAPSEGAAISLSPGASPLASPSSVLSSSSVGTPASVDGNSLQMFAQPFNIMLPSVPSIPLSPPTLTPPSASPPLVGQPFTSIESLSTRPLLSGHLSHHYHHRHHHHHRVPTLPSPPPTVSSSASTSNNSGQSSQETELSPWPSPSKRTQHLVNPFTGQLEPMSSEDDDSTDGFLLRDDSFHDVVIGVSTSLGQFSETGKSSNVCVARSTSLPSVTSSAIVGLMGSSRAGRGPPASSRGLVSASFSSSTTTTSSSASSCSSASTSSSPSPPATPSSLVAPISASSSPSEKIKLRLKLEPKQRIEKEKETVRPGEKVKADPGTCLGLQYKVDVSFVNIPTSATPRRNSGNGITAPCVSSSAGSIGGCATTTISTSGSISSCGTAGAQNVPSPGTAPEPRVPPLHISLRGRNATVVLNPRREDREKVREGTGTSLPEAPTLVKTQRARSPRGSKQEDSKIGGASMDVRSPGSSGGRRNSASRGGLTPTRGRGAAASAVNLYVPNESRSVLSPSPPSSAMNVAREKALLSGGCMFVESLATTTAGASVATSTPSECTASTTPVSSTCTVSSQPFPSGLHESKTPVLPAAAVVSSVQIPRQMGKSESEFSLVSSSRRPQLLASSFSAPPSPFHETNLQSAENISDSHDPNLENKNEEVVAFKDEVKVKIESSDAPSQATMHPQQSFGEEVSTEETVHDTTANPVVQSLETDVFKDTINRSLLPKGSELVRLERPCRKSFKTSEESTFGPVIVKGVTVVAPCYNNLHSVFSKEGVSSTVNMNEIKEEPFSVASPLCQQDEKRDISGTVSPKSLDVCVNTRSQPKDATKRVFIESSSEVYDPTERKSVAGPPGRVGIEQTPTVAADDIKAGSLDAVCGLKLVEAVVSKTPSEKAIALLDEISHELENDALRTTGISATDNVVCAGPCVSVKRSEMESSSVRVDATLVGLNSDQDSVEKKRAVSYASVCRDSEIAEQISLKEVTANIAVKEEPPDILLDSCALVRAEECKIGSRGATIKVNCIVESGEDIPLSRKLLSPISTTLDSSKSVDDVEVPLGLDLKPSSPKIPRIAKISSLGASEKLRLAAAVGASGVTHIVGSNRGHHPMVDDVCMKPIGCLPEEEVENDAVIGDDLSSSDALSHHTNLHNLLSSTRSSVATISASPSSASPSGSSPDSLHIGTSSEDNGDSSSTGRQHGGEGRMHGHHHHTHHHHHNPRGRCSSNGSPYEDSGIDSMDAIIEKLSGGGSPSDPPHDGLPTRRDVGALSSTCSKNDNSRNWHDSDRGQKEVDEQDVDTVCAGSGLDETNNDHGGESQVEPSDSEVPVKEPNSEPIVTEMESDTGNECLSVEEFKQKETLKQQCTPPMLDTSDERFVPEEEEEEKKDSENEKETVRVTPPLSPKTTSGVEVSTVEVDSGEVVSSSGVESLPDPSLNDTRSVPVEDESRKPCESETYTLAESEDALGHAEGDVLSSLFLNEANNDEKSRSSSFSDTEATQLLVLTVQDVNSIVMSENEEQETSRSEVPNLTDGAAETEPQFAHEEGVDGASDVPSIKLDVKSPSAAEGGLSTLPSSVDEQEAKSPAEVMEASTSDKSDVPKLARGHDSKTIAPDDIEEEAQSPVSTSILTVSSTASSSSFVANPLQKVSAPQVQTATDSSPARTLPLKTASISSNPIKLSPVLTSCSSMVTENGGVGVTHVVTAPSVPTAPSPLKVLVSHVCPVSGCASTTSPTVTLTTVVVKSVVVTTASIVARPTVTNAGVRTPITSISQNTDLRRGVVHLPTVGTRSTTPHYNSIPDETVTTTPVPNVSAAVSKSTSLVAVSSSKASSLDSVSLCEASALPLLTNKTWLVPTVINTSNEPPVLSPNPTPDAHISTDPPHLQSPFLDLSTSANSCAEEEDDAEPFPRLSPAVDLEDGHRDSSISSDHDSECSSHGSCDSSSHMGGSRHFKDDPDDLFMGNISITSGDHNYIVRASRVNRGDRERRIVCDSQNDRRQAEDSFRNTNDCDREVAVVSSANESVLSQLSIEIPSETDGERRSTRCTRSSSRMASPNMSISKQQTSPNVNSCAHAASASPLPTSNEGQSNCHAENDVVRMLPSRSAAKRKREDSEDSDSRKIDGDGVVVNNEKGHSRAKSPLVVEMTAHFYSKPVKRKCSENAVELIKACIGVDDAPKRTSNAKHMNMEVAKVHGGGGANKAGKAKEDGSKSKSGGCQNAAEGSEESSDDEVTLSELATKARSIRGKHVMTNDDRNVTRNSKQRQNSSKEDDTTKGGGTNSRSTSNNRKDNDGRSSRSGMASQRDSRGKDERVTSRTSRHADRNRRSTPPPRGQERSPQRISHRSRARDNDRGATSPPPNHPVREDGEIGRRKLRSNTSSVSGYYDTLPQKRRRMSRDHR